MDRTRSAQYETKTVRYLFRRGLYAVLTPDGRWLMSTWKALPQWAKEILRADKRDLYRLRRDKAAGLRPIEGLPDDKQPQEPSSQLDSMPKRVKWLQDMPVEKFERAVSGLLSQWWAKEKGLK